MVWLRVLAVCVLASLGSCRHADSIKDWDLHNAFPQRSAPFSSASEESKSSVRQSPTFDYSQGFPSEFSKGLPRFDFSTPMGAKDKQDESETENVGFVSGPPDGFPTLEQLGGMFSNFGESTEQGQKEPRPQPYRANSHVSSQRHPQPEEGPHNSRPYPSRPPRPENEYFGPSGPGPRGPPPPSAGPPRPYSRPPATAEYEDGSYEESMDSERAQPPYHGPGRFRGPPPPPYGSPSSLYQPYQEGPSPPHYPQSYHKKNKEPEEPKHAATKDEVKIPHSYQPKKPIVLKVSGKKTKNYKLPPGPPVFYAPSPDMTHEHQQDNTGAGSYKATYRPPQGQQHGASDDSHHEPSEELYHGPPQGSYQRRPERQPQGSYDGPSEQLPQGSYHGPPEGMPERRPRGPPLGPPQGPPPPYHHPNMRYKRSTASEEPASKSKSVEEKKEDSLDTFLEKEDLKPSASDDTFWELTSSPFLVFDTYKNDEHDHDEPSLTSGNVTFVDTDGGEQRFFPSFPAPAPYLVGPYSNSPPSRAPLFPGPAANRPASRYHPGFGPKYSAPPPPPNRGPSNIYSAESHDHYQDNNLLGSGNFEVVRGGTYYGDDDDGYHGGHSGHYHGDHDDDYYPGNGHSAPEGYRVPGHGHGGDFFANFRDFADINPPSRSFSHRHEAVAALPEDSPLARQPKNILDKLESSAIDIGSSYSPVPHSTISRESDPMMATF